jgi:hypothetical protein
LSSSYSAIFKNVGLLLPSPTLLKPLPHHFQKRLSFSGKLMQFIVEWAKRFRLLFYVVFRKTNFLKSDLNLYFKKTTCPAKGTKHM